jgi:hypothetical protein
MEKDRVTTIMFNDTPQALETVVDVSMPCGYWTGPDVRAIGESVNSTCEVKQVLVETERRGSSAHCRLTIPAHGTVNLNFQMDNFGKLAKSISKIEQFGDRTFVPIKYGNQSWINIKSVSVGNPTLRLGLLGATGSERLKCRINGREMSLKSTSIQEIQLATTDIRFNNKIEVYLTEPSNNPRLVLAFTSIVSEKTDRSK